MQARHEKFAISGGTSETIKNTHTVTTEYSNKQKII